MCRLVRIATPSAELVETAVAAATEPVERAATTVGGSVDDDGVGSLATVFAIRRAVFVTEQGIDPATEWDGRDEDATHLLALADGRPVGTARLRWLDAETAKPERVAVLPGDRAAGYGTQLMDACADYALAAGATRCVLHAQRSSAAFYENQGYRVVGEPFEEAGIPHVKMVLPLADG